MKFTPYNYQQQAIDWIIGHRYCGLFLDMGLGKTVVTLTAIVRLMDELEVTRTLVVAPKKVAETTWTTEAGKWDHLSALRVVRVMGTEKQRLKALDTDADIYVLGRDSFTWLAKHYDYRLPFEMVVLDELSSFKTPSSQRFKAVRKSRPFLHRVIGLTGTPAPNGLIDLWAQIYCLDLGKRLGPFVTRYREAYFNEHRWNNIVVKCTPKKGAEEAIRSKVSDICLSMSAADYLQLPDLITHTERVILPEAEKRAYDRFERDRVMEFKEEQGQAVAASAAALMTKLSQYANGAIYDDEHNVHTVSTAKLDKLAEIVEGASPVLVFYQYRHDVPRIMERLKGYHVETYEGEQQLTAWNQGKIDVLLAHPASTAYGLNMQQGGHYVVWFGTGWNLELYQQANARLHRQGQQHPVIVYHLICEGTVDELALAAIERKSSVQQALLDGLGELTKKYSYEQEQRL